jgi:hypothetical protein
MTLEQMQAQRAQLLKEIQRRGGVAKAPQFAAKLTALDSDIRAARKQTSGQTSAGGQQTDPGGVSTGQQGDQSGDQQEDTGAAASGDPARQAARLAWLKKNRPNDPQVKELEEKLAKQPGDGNTGGDGGAGKGTLDMDSLNAWLDSALEGLNPIDASKAPKVLSADDLEADRQAAQDSLYNESTKYLDRNRDRQMEETRQQLAERGIPFDPAAVYDPNTKNIYGKTLGAINEDYAAQQASALDKARTGSYALEKTRADVNVNQYNAWADAASKEFYSKRDALNAGGSLLQSLMTKYGIDKQTAQDILDRKSREKIAKWGLSKIGGSGGNSGGGQSGAGFEIS